MSAVNEKVNNNMMIYSKGFLLLVFTVKWIFFNNLKRLATPNSSFFYEDLEIFSEHLGQVAWAKAGLLYKRGCFIWVPFRRAGD